MLDELSKSVKAALYDRVSSPLWGAFLISWVIWNHEFILVFFSELPVPEKLQFLSLVAGWRHCFISESGSFLCKAGNVFLWPLLSALIFLFIYPWPARGVFRYWRWQQKLLREVQQKIEGESCLTKEESRKVWQEFKAEKRSYENEMDHLRGDVSRLKSELSAENGLRKKQNEDYLRQIEQLEEQIHSKNLELDKLEKEYVNLDRKAQNLIVMGSGNNSSLVENEDKFPSKTEKEIRANLASKKYKLYFNPKVQKGSKIISFSSSGDVMDGKNKNEFRWRVRRGKLELIREDGDVHSLFDYVPESGIFLHTPNQNTPSIKGQFMIPET